jgi:hypothetical protein
MKKTMRTTAILVALALAVAVPGLAQEEDQKGDSGAGNGLMVERALIASDVDREGREPLDESSQFPADIGQVACFTSIAGAPGETVIFHVWKRGKQEMARVELAVRASNWRTWSTKKILPEWTGDWTVEIQDADGKVLHTVRFNIGHKMETAGTAS